MIKVQFTRRSLLSPALLLLAVSLLMVSLLPRPAIAARTVTVTLPDFSVTLKGQPIDNACREYPLICYKGITYFPLTWQDSRFMGLTTSWSEETGLIVAKDADQTARVYAADQASVKNRSRSQAQVVDYPIRVNGKTVDNAAEPYPLLSFRDIVYFPLTWRFAAEEFGWNYQFDAGGLVISDEQQAERFTALSLRLPLYQTEIYSGSAVVHGDKVFYAGPERKNISMASVDNPRDTKVIYQLLDTDILGFPTLYKDNGQIYLEYFAGYSNITASYSLVRLNLDGTAEELTSTGLIDLPPESDISLRLSKGSIPYTKNLCIKKTKDQEFRHFGPPYLYLANSKASDAYLFDGAIYTLANPEGEKYEEIFLGSDLDTSYLYRICLETEQAEKISEQPVFSMKKQDDYLYYLDGAHYLTRLNLKTKEVERLWEETAASFSLDELIILRPGDGRCLLLTVDGDFLSELLADEGQMVFCQKNRIIFIQSLK